MRLIAAILLIATAAYAGPDDLEFRTLSLTGGQQVVISKPDFKSGYINEIDVAGLHTGAYSVLVSTPSTNGSRVAKTILSLSGVTLRSIYPVRQRPVNSSGSTMTNECAVPFYLAREQLMVTITNMNTAVTNDIVVTIKMREE